MNPIQQGVDNGHAKIYYQQMIFMINWSWLGGGEEKPILMYIMLLYKKIMICFSYFYITLLMRIPYLVL
jgi:hypothetical protein